MTLAVRVVSEVAATMGLVPLAWLAGNRLRGRRLDVAYWWLALAFAVSWIADFAAQWTGQAFVSILYPVTQAALIGFVFLDTDRERVALGAYLALVAVAAILWRGIDQPDVLLHTAAWLAVVGIAADRWALGRLRVALLVYFGVGWLAWIGYVIVPGWPTWGALQLARLAGLLWFCYATLETGPALRVSSNVPRVRRVS